MKHLETVFCESGRDLLKTVRSLFQQLKLVFKKGK